MTFDLRASVRSVLDTTNLTSPAEIAAKVAESVPSKDLRTTLAAALETYVRVQFSRDRGWGPTPAVGPANVSAKVAAYQADAWRRKLHNRFPVGAGQDRLMADLSYDNFLYIAEVRRAHAAANIAAAERAERCAEAMVKAKVDRFGDLSDAVLRELLADEDGTR